MINATIYKLILCHFVGDYVLQTDFLAQTKGKNWWHMIAHCFLYSLPFCFAFGFDWKIGFIVATHFAIDNLKARWNDINYLTDQVAHMIVLAIYLIPHG